MQSVATQSHILTKRETEALELKANALALKLIADNMGCTERTVKAHIGNAKEKLDANDLASLINKAWLMGVLRKACLSFLSGLVLHAITALSDVERPVRYRLTRTTRNTTQGRREDTYHDELELVITTTKRTTQC